jgi:hypothetical protein
MFVIIRVDICVDMRYNFDTELRLRSDVLAIAPVAL